MFGLVLLFGLVAGWPSCSWWWRLWKARKGWRHLRAYTHMSVLDWGLYLAGVLARFETDGGTCDRFVRLL